MSQIAYSVKCPKCAAKATAHVHATGTKGTYRELLLKFGARRIICEACGFCRELSPDDLETYELWYVTDFKGHRLWAKNLKHVAFLTSWLSGTRSKAQLKVADRAVVEALPKWMILAKNRDEILKCLRQMSDRGAKKAPQRSAKRRVQQ